LPLSLRVGPTSTCNAPPNNNGATRYRRWFCYLGWVAHPSHFGFCLSFQTVGAPFSRGVCARVG
jgi:hypothetical protein